MKRIITDPKLLGSAEGATAKPYGNDPDWDILYWKWRDDMDNNPGPSQFVLGQGHFKVGDVIHDTGGLARIIDIRAQRGGDFSFYYYMPKYKVQPITKKGQWSKRWCYTWPGMVQRAYAEAGL